MQFLQKKKWRENAKKRTEKKDEQEAQCLIINEANEAKEGKNRKKEAEKNKKSKK